MQIDTVWVFHSAGARFAGGTFSNMDSAEEWISKNNLTGVLTAYPLNKGVFEWAVEGDMFKPRNEKHMTPEFIGGFTSARQEHYHYENGKRS